MPSHETGFSEVGGARVFVPLADGAAAIGVCVGCAIADTAGWIWLTAVPGAGEPTNPVVPAASMVIGILRPGTGKKCSSGRTRPKHRMPRQRINRQRA